MVSLPDSHTEARHAALRDMQAGPARQQSDFEKKLAFRLAFLVATVVIGFNLFAPAPQNYAATAARHARS